MRVPTTTGWARRFSVLLVYSITAWGLSALNRRASRRGPIHVVTFGTASLLSLSERKGVEDPADLAQDYLPALTTFSLCADEATWAATKRATGTRKGEQET